MVEDLFMILGPQEGVGNVIGDDTTSKQMWRLEVFSFDEG